MFVLLGRASRGGPQQAPNKTPTCSSHHLPRVRLPSGPLAETPCNVDYGPSDTIGPRTSDRHLRTTPRPHYGPPYINRGRTMFPGVRHELIHDVASGNRMASTSSKGEGISVTWGRLPYEGRDVTMLSESAFDHVSYLGTRSLLDLRGGGPHVMRHPPWDDGRGVAAWMDADDDYDESHATPRELHCDVCGAHPPTVDWAWCACQQRQCEACLARPCELCARRCREQHEQPEQFRDVGSDKDEFEEQPGAVPFILRLEDHLDDSHVEHLRWLDDNPACGLSYQHWG